MMWQRVPWHRLQPVRCKSGEGLAQRNGQRRGRSLQRLKPVRFEAVTAGLKPGPPKSGHRSLESRDHFFHSEARFSPRNLSVLSASQPREIPRCARNDRSDGLAQRGMPVRFGKRGERGGIFFRLLFFLFFLGFCAVVYVARHPLMRFAGEFWVVDEQAAPSDALVVLGDDNYSGDRAFHAAELYREGVAPVIVASGRMLRQNASAADLIEHDLESFGVPAASIVKLSHRADNTKDEAIEVAKLVEARHWKRVLVVTSNYHARRARFIYGRVLPSSVTLRVSGARDSEFDPARWWQTRRGEKLFFTELAAYLAARWELRSGAASENANAEIMVHFQN
jgi:uncharacterized SAM-binding protein YcdF (DUF218 family)